MKCPHCLIQFHDRVETLTIGTDVDGKWHIEKRVCPNCNKLVLNLIQIQYLISPSTHGSYPVEKGNVLIRPKVSSRPPVPLEVPEEFAKDYREACLVFADSPMSSAALSRRCLQHIIREKLGIKKRDLNQEIQEIIDNGLLPSDLLESVDSIRNIGNFAAHPIKSQSTGEIVEVEPAEAEWNLDVLELLFEFLFVRPEVIKRKRDALNDKLKDAGKPPVK